LPLGNFRYHDITIQFERQIKIDPGGLEHRPPKCFNFAVCTFHRDRDYEAYATWDDVI